MTASQIRGALWKYFYVVENDKDGVPQAVPTRPDYELPNKARWLLSVNRHLFGYVPPRKTGLTEGEKRHCRKSQAMLETAFGPVELKAFGRPNGDRVYIRNLDDVPTIPFEDVMPNPAPGEPPF